MCGQKWNADLLTIWLTIYKQQYCAIPVYKENLPDQTSGVDCVFKTYSLCRKDLLNSGRDFEV